MSVLRLKLSFSLTLIELLTNYRYLTPEFAWKQQYAPFADGCGALLVVSPGRIMMWVCDAEAVNQITTRRNDFPKPTEFYGSVDLFGKNVVST